MNILHSNTYIQYEIRTGYDKYIVDDVLCLFTTCLRFNTIHARRETVPDHPTLADWMAETKKKILSVGKVQTRKVRPM